VEYQRAFYDSFVELVGDTDPARAKTGTIRSLSTDSLEKAVSEKRAVRNMVHRSTTPEETEREATIFFGDDIQTSHK
jgi:nucleoside-diphosphate kinase